jgi:hypothetical protein
MFIINMFVVKPVQQQLKLYNELLGVDEEDQHCIGFISKIHSFVHWRKEDSRDMLHG